MDRTALRRRPARARWSIQQPEGGRDPAPLPRVAYVIRGDGEIALPALLRAFAGRPRSAKCRTSCSGTRAVACGGRPRPTSISTDTPADVRRRLPGGSLRVDARLSVLLQVLFVSSRVAPVAVEVGANHPHGLGDYATDNNAERISAMDSTFTVPPARFRELLAALSAARRSPGRRTRGPTTSTPTRTPRGWRRRTARASRSGSSR